MKRIDLRPSRPNGKPTKTISMGRAVRDPSNISKAQRDREHYLDHNLANIEETRRVAVADGCPDSVILSGSLLEQPIKALYKAREGEETTQLIIDAVQAKGMLPSGHLYLDRDLARDIFNLLDPGSGDIIAEPSPPGLFTAVIVLGGGHLTLYIPEP